MLIGRHCLRKLGTKVAWCLSGFWLPCYKRWLKAHWFWHLDGRLKTSGGKFFSLLFRKVVASWSLARENANGPWSECGGVYDMTDSGTKVPPSLDCSELTTARNFQQHHHPDRHSVDDIAHKIRQIPFSPGDEYLRCPSTQFCFPHHRGSLKSILWIRMGFSSCSMSLQVILSFTNQTLVLDSQHCFPDPRCNAWAP